MSGGRGIGGSVIILIGMVVLLSSCASADATAAPKTVSGGWWLSSTASKDDQQLQRQYNELLMANEALNAKLEELRNQPPETVVVKEVQVVNQVEEVPVYHELREFQDLNELRDWVDSWIYIPTSVNGTVDLMSDANDCDDWSLAMVQDAARDGYITGVVLDIERSHLFICCIIGNRFYFVEPQSGDIYETIHNTYWLVD